MRIYRFRILLDYKQSVFRDIELGADAHFSDLHNAIIEAFAFTGIEMASFYMSDDDWNKGDEISLMDVHDPYEGGDSRTMDETLLSDMLDKEGEKMLYVYDFMKLWIFYVELVSVVNEIPATTYPRVVLVVGDAPTEDSRKSADPMVVEMDGDNPNIDPDLDFDESDVSDDSDSFY